jgi:hypothetical protein
VSEDQLERRALVLIIIIQLYNFNIIFGLIFCSTSSGQGHRTNLAPQSMQWAIRNRDTATRTATGKYLYCY